MTRICADCPAEIARDSKRCRRCAALAPERRAISSAVMKRLRADPAVHVRMVAASADARMPWCPREYRQLNRDLIAKHMRLAERKQMIAEQIERDRRRAA